jgi:hypothetical protein
MIHMIKRRPFVFTLLSVITVLGAFQIMPASAQIGPPIGPPPVTIYPAPTDLYTLDPSSASEQGADGFLSVASMQKLIFTPIFWPWFWAFGMAGDIPEPLWTPVQKGPFFPNQWANQINEARVLFKAAGDILIQRPAR